MRKAMTTKAATKPKARSPQASPRPVGRPTKYEPSYVDQIVDFMAQGFSPTAFAGSIRVSRSTLDNWGAEHPEFLEALQTARACRVYKLEDGMLSAKNGPEVTARIFALKNAAPDEWRDRQEVTGADGAPVRFVIEGSPEPNR